ncbi:MAG: hypothetical protein IT427_03375 [Pirellulales bacterium]|nr:hypothetical protein [Pirellulales bacterium]
MKLAGNRTSRDLPSGSLDQLYSYDGLDRLVSYQEGTIGGGSIGSPTKQADWALDGLGNWSGSRQFTGCFSDGRTQPSLRGALGEHGESADQRRPLSQSLSQTADRLPIPAAAIYDRRVHWGVALGLRTVGQYPRQDSNL